MNTRRRRKPSIGNGQPLAARIRDLCLQRGWDSGELARRAGISRTTLYHLEQGKTRRPHWSTLSKVAAALDVSPEELWGISPQGVRPAPLVESAAKTTRNQQRQRDFDRSTNLLIKEVCEERPELFRDWSRAEWDELYSTFGTGGHLSAEGVSENAQAINRKRETVQQLHLILDTHLSEVAARMIDTLYQMISADRSESAKEQAADSGASPRP